MAEALLDIENFVVPFAHEAPAEEHADGTRRHGRASRQYFHDCCVTLDELAGGSTRVSYGKSVDIRVTSAHHHLRQLGWWIVDVPMGPDEADLAIKRRLEASDWSAGPYVLGSADKENVVNPTLVRLDRGGDQVMVSFVFPPDAHRLATRMSAEAAGRYGVVMFAQAHRERVAREQRDTIRRAGSCVCPETSGTGAEPGRPDGEWLTAATHAAALFPVPGSVGAASVEDARSRIADPLPPTAGLVERLRRELRACEALVDGGPTDAATWHAVCQVALLVPEARKLRDRPGAAASYLVDVPALALPWDLAMVIALG